MAHVEKSIIEDTLGRKSQTAGTLHGFVMTLTAGREGPGPAP